MPELLFKVNGEPDTSPCQWREGGTNWLMSKGGAVFRVSRSTDSGVTWTMIVPQFSSGYGHLQPINSGFHAPDGAMYVATDGVGGESHLWRSLDNGLTWNDQGGRTSGRHSTIVPLDGTGRLLSLGGKNTDINGYMPQNISTNRGVTWEAPTQSPFPKLAQGQRPSVCRLASGKLVMVGDASFVTTTKPPEGRQHAPAPGVQSGWALRGLHLGSLGP